MSGQQIGSLVGGVIGAYFGGPYGYAIGSAIGGAIGGYVDPTVIKGPKLTDATQQTANDGIPIPWGHGTFPTAGNIIWTSELRERKKEDDGKGTGIVNVTYHYYRSYAIGICSGVRQSDGTYLPIEGILQVKRNGKIVYDVQPGIDGEQTAQNSKFMRHTRFYLGSETQDPDSVIESELGVGNAPAYPGMVYMVRENEELTELGGAIPQYEFVVSVCGTTITPVPDELELLDTMAAVSIAVEWSDDSQYVAAGGYFDSRPDNYLWIYKENEGAFDPVTIDDPPNDRPEGGIAWEPMGSRFFLASDSHELLVYAVAGTTATLVETIPNPSHLAEAQARGVAWVGGYLWVAYSNGIVARWDSGTFEYLSSQDIDLGAVPEGPHGMTPGEVSGVIVSVTASPGVVVVSGSGEVTSGPFAAATSRPKLNRFGDLAVVSGTTPYWQLSTGETMDAAASTALALSWSPDGYHIVVGGRVFRRSGTHYGLFQDLYPSSLTNASAFSPDGQYLAISEASDLQIWTGFNLVGAVELPDAPGYYLNPDGTIVGPEGETLERCKPTLGEIVADACQRAGLTTDDFDVSELVDQVDGFKVATETTAEAIIAPLMNGFFFDAGEWDDKIRFIKRGGDVVAELTVDDLCESDGDVIEETELQEAELLRKVHVQTIDPAAGFIVTTQTAERRTSTVKARGEQTTQIAVVTDKDTQARMADKRLKVAWSETRRFATCIPYTRPDLTVTDVIGLTDKKGRRQRVRLMEMAEDSGRIEIKEAMLDRQSSYTSNVEGTTKTPPTNTSPGIIGPTFGVPMNLPSLRTSDNVPGAYLAACGYLSAWGGCAVLLSVDAGASFQQVMLFDEASHMGTLTAACTDTGEPIEVFMNSGTLSSITDAQLALRMNGFAITTSEVSELGQFKTATLNVDGGYDLTETIRGGLGTTPAAHSSGDPFVMVATARFLPLDIALAGRTLYFKFVSFGTSPDDANAVPFVFNPLFTNVTVEAYADENGEIYTDENTAIYYSETST